MFSKHLIDAFVRQVLTVVPAKSDASLKQFIAKQPPIAGRAPTPLSRGGEPHAPHPTPLFQVLDWFFVLRRYEERALKQNFLEIWVGTGKDFWGYLRLNPYFYDEEGKDRKVWEIPHAFAYTKFRGRGINLLYVTLALELARVNVADLLVANPRHVAMLITLNDLGFQVRGAGGSQQSIRRIIKQGRAWYRKDANARRLYYAQELRSFMTDGSLMLQKDLAHERFWKIF